MFDACGTTNSVYARSLQLLKRNLLHALIGFRSDAHEIAVFLGCDTVSLCDK